MIYLEGLEQQIELDDTFTNEYRSNDAIYRFTIGPLETNVYKEDKPDKLCVSADAKWSLEKIKITDKIERRHNPPIEDKKEETSLWKMEGKYRFISYNAPYGKQEIEKYRPLIVKDLMASKIFITPSLIYKIIPEHVDEKILKTAEQLIEFVKNNLNHLIKAPIRYYD